MSFRRHPLILIAIGFAIVPAMIELLNGVRAGVMMAGGSAGALRWFDSSFASDTPWEALFRTRWPILMLLTGLALLQPRSRWAVPMAWAYVIAAAVTGLARIILSEWPSYLLQQAGNGSLPTAIFTLSAVLSYLMPLALDLLPAVFLLIAAKALRAAAASPVVVPVAAVAAPESNGATRLLGYHTGQSTANPSRTALRLAFAVACMATVRSVCELVLLGGNLVIARRDWNLNTLPTYLFSDSAVMSIDAMSEYALRIGWLLLLIGLWPSRRLVLSRRLVDAGVIAMTAWALLELMAVLVSGEGGFTIAGHPAAGALSSLRIEISEMAVMAMIVALLRSPLPADQR